MLTLITLMATASAGQLREPVLDLLGAHDAAAPNDAYAALGEGVDAELMAIAVDPEISHSRRARAVSALGHFPTATTRSFLEARLVDEDKLLRRKAAWALASGWKDEALPLLAPLLTDGDIHVRAAGARAVASVKSTASRELLAARLPEEKDATVIAALRAGLVEDAP